MRRAGCTLRVAWHIARRLHGMRRAPHAPTFLVARTPVRAARKRAPALGLARAWDTRARAHRRVARGMVTPDGSVCAGQK
jgi:hypothetical protein